MDKKQKLARDLIRAFDSEDLQKARELIALGADINASGRWSGDCTMLWLRVDAAGQEISKTFRDLSVEFAELFPGASHRNSAAERERHLRVLQSMIEAKADVNKRSNGGTPLRIAVCGQDLEVVKLLLANGANPNAETLSILSNLAHKTKPGYWNTVLHEAVMKGSLPIAEALLAAGADPNRTDHEGKTPLAIAQEKGFAELVTLLQGRTTVQSVQPANPSDDVWRAASEGRLVDLQQLIADGANVNATDAEKATPLHKAAAAGQMAVVKWLAEHGANLNAKLRDRSTPLLLAASAGHTEVVQLLVFLKADVDAAERGGHTPFAAAVVHGNLEIADFLLRHGANPNHQTKGILNMTVLMHVAGQKLLKAVEFLLAAGADARLCDARGQNALHHAVSGAVVHQVLDIGPGESSLVPEGDPKDALPIVERLLAYGADPNARDEDGETPLNCARKLRLTDIARAMERHGGTT